MEKFTTLTGVAAPFPMINVDTDRIIPKQFLKTIERTGLGKYLFYDLRYDEQGALTKLGAVSVRYLKPASDAELPHPIPHAYSQNHALGFHDTERRLVTRTGNAAVLELGASLLFIAAVFQLFDGLQGVVTGTLRGLGDTRTPMVTNLAAHWLVGLPAGYWLCFAAGWGARGLWWGLSIGLIVALWRPAPAFALVGGALAGAAIDAMHFTGMAAYRVDGLVEWQAPYVIVSLLCAVVFSSVAFAVLCSPRVGRHRIALGTGLFITAIVTLHFIAMTALKITPQGMRFLKNKESIQLRLDEKASAKADKSARKAPDAIILNDDADRELFGRLKALRLSIAREQNLPPYVVFHDKTLIEIALKKPATMEEFAGIGGVGQSKREKYGRLFLDAVNSGNADF